MPSAQCNALSVAVVPQVVSPARVLGEWNGFVVVLVGVEVWPGDLVVRVAFGSNERTLTVDAEYSRAMDEWHALIDSGLTKDERGNPPRNPAHDVLSDLKVDVRDDVGTTYEWNGGSGPSWSGKTGTRWLMEQQFTPPPPPAAQRLTVAVTFPNGDVATVDCQLDA